MVALASITGGPSGTALTPANYLRVLADQYHWDVILVTFRLAFYTTLICVALGYPLAWYLVRVVRWRAWRRACVILLVVPLFTSNIVRAFGWMVLLGRNGLVNQALMATGAADRPVRFIGAELGILIGMVYVLLPRGAGRGQCAGARRPGLRAGLGGPGRQPAATFVHVTWPLTLPGVISGAIIVFTLAVSAYVTPALLSGGRVTVLSMLIFQQYSTVFDFHYGGALSMVLLVLTLILVALANRATVPPGGAR